MNSRKQAPEIQVGIFSGEEISFTLNTPFKTGNKFDSIDGRWKAKFILYGAGWGHGVGLCQIGAAVMGSNRYSYREILMHYFRGAVLEKRY